MQYIVPLLDDDDALIQSVKLAYSPVIRSGLDIQNILGQVKMTLFQAPQRPTCLRSNTDAGFLGHLKPELEILSHYRLLIPPV